MMCARQWLSEESDPSCIKNDAHRMGWCKNRLNSQKYSCRKETDSARNEPDLPNCWKLPVVVRT